MTEKPGLQADLTEFSTKPAFRCLPSHRSPLEGLLSQRIYRLITLVHLRFTSSAMINLRRDLHPQECAHAGAQREKSARRRLFLRN